MSKKKFNLKLLIIPIIVLIIVIFGIFFTYENYFAPKVPVTSVNTDVNLNTSNLALDFIPDKVDFSLSKIALGSNVKVSDTELTDMIILALQNDSNTTLKQITGLQIIINDNYINVYATFDLLNVPLEVHFKFVPEVENGQAILHYVEGNIGFIPIPKDIVFDHLANKSFMSIDSSAGDIIFKFDNSDAIKIDTFSIDGSSLKIGITSSIDLSALGIYTTSIPSI